MYHKWLEFSYKSFLKKDLEGFDKPTLQLMLLFICVVNLKWTSQYYFYSEDLDY